MSGSKRFVHCPMILILFFFLMHTAGFVWAAQGADTFAAVFLDADGNIVSCSTSEDSESVKPPDAVSEFGWAREDYAGRTGCFVVLPSVTEPEDSKVYTGVYVNDKFVPVYSSDVVTFSGRDDGSTYYYEGFSEEAASLSWNGFAIDFRDEDADWRIGADEFSISEEPQILYDDIKEKYKTGYLTPSDAVTTYVAPTAENYQFYTVTFIWPDGMDTRLVRSGEAAEPPALGESYNGWFWSSSAYQDVQGELYVSLYDPSEEAVLVTWQDCDGNVLETASVPATAVPAFPSPNPQLGSDDDCVYVFAGWEKISDSGSDYIYRAVYRSIPRWTVTIRYRSSVSGLLLAVQRECFSNHAVYAIIPPHINGYNAPTTVSGTIEGANVVKTLRCPEKLFYGKQGYLLDGQFIELDDVIVKFNTGTYCVYNVGRHNTTPLKVAYDDGTGEQAFYFKYPVYGSTSGSYGDKWLYGTSPEDITTPFLCAMGDGDEYLYMRYVGLRPTTKISDLEPLYVAYAEKFYTVTFVYPGAEGTEESLVLTTVEGGAVTPPELPDLYEWETDTYQNVTETLKIHAKQTCEGHEPVKDEKVAPTCEETGVTEGTHCRICGKILVPQEEIPPTGHTPAVDEAVAASCLESGLSEGSHCSICGKILIEQEVIPALGHAWMASEYVWADNYGSVTATHVCSRDERHMETETAETISEVVQPPSWDRKGKTEYTAAFQNSAFAEQTKTVEDLPVIPLEGESWGTCEWVLYDGILTVSAGEGADTGGRSPWIKYSGYISEIDFEAGVSFPVDSSGLFNGLSHVESIRLDAVLTGNTVDFHSMFSGCDSLESLDLRAFDTGKAESMDGMFAGCTALTGVVLGDGFTFYGNTDHILTTFPKLLLWKMDLEEKKMSALQVAQKNQGGEYTGILPAMYWGSCPIDLQDGVCTVYEGNGVPKTSKTISTGTNSWIYTYYYPWSADGVKEEVHHLIFTEGVHFPGISDCLIQNMPALESVTMEEGVDTTDVTSFTYAFAGSGPALKKIDLSGATSESLLDTSDMFHGSIDSGVEELILGAGFTCEHVTDMEFMFTWMQSLKELDLSYIDPSSAVIISNFIKRCESLQKLDLSGKDFSKGDSLSGWFESMPSLKLINLTDTVFPSNASWKWPKEDVSLEVVIAGTGSDLPISFYEALPAQEVNGSTEWFSLDSQTYGSAEELRQSVVDGDSGVLIKWSMETGGTESIFDRKEHAVSAVMKAPDGFRLVFKSVGAEAWVEEPPVFSDICPEDEPYQIQARIVSDHYAESANWFVIDQYIRPGSVSSFENVLILPDNLTRIEEEAFSGTSAQMAVLPDGCTEIGRRAFGDCDALLGVYIPASVTKIDPDAFEGSYFVIYAPEGSYAEQFAQDRNIQFVRW